MSTALTRFRLPFFIALVLVAIAVGLAAFAPSVRKDISRALGLDTSATQTLALNQCSIAAASDPDHIYFLSCGGIY